MHDLRTDGDGGSAGDTFKLADDEQIRHAVKGLEKIGQQIGQRKKQKVFKDTAGGKIFFHNMTSLS